MKFALPFILCSLFVLSCDSEPDYEVLDDDRLVLVLKDLQYARAATYGQGMATKDSLMTIYKEQIGEIHGISAGDLDANIRALQEDPEKLLRIYELLENHLDSLQK